MNRTITTRFNHYQQLLIESPVISQFTVVKQSVTRRDGRIRVRATLTDSGLLEFAEYLSLNDNNLISDRTYAFHWQNALQQLVKRWDNVNHFPDLPRRHTTFTTPMEQ
ncbi:MAG: hypothetical protein Kow0031_01490 [Anaerolineae bacterium]